MNKAMHISFQLALLLAVCLAGEFIAPLLPFKFSASVLSMLILLLLLAVKAVKYENIKPTSDFLLGNMALLFVPLGVSLLEYTHIISENLVLFAVVVLLTTPVVYAAAALTAQAVINWQDKRGTK